MECFKVWKKYVYLCYLVQWLEQNGGDFFGPNHTLAIFLIQLCIHLKKVDSFPELIYKRWKFEKKANFIKTKLK